MVDAERPRRRIRPGPPAASRPDQSATGCSARTSGVHDPGREQADPSRRPSPGDEERETDRGLRGLIGSGTSQVSVTTALRARDAARPTDNDIIEAEQRLVIVRRNWVPPDAPSRAR